MPCVSILASISCLYMAGISFFFYISRFFFYISRVLSYGQMLYSLVRSTFECLGVCLRVIEELAYLYKGE